MRNTIVCLHLLAGFAAVGLGSVAAETPVVTVTKTKELQQEINHVSLLYETLKRPEATTIEIVAAAQADYSRIVATLYDHGLFGSTVNITLNGREAADIPPFENLGTITSAKITVDEGDVFVFGKTQIAPLPQNVEPTPEFAVGETASTGTIQTAVDRSLSAWRDESYPKAKVADQTLVADHNDKTLDAEFTIDPGPKAQFGNLNIKGNARMREARIRKIAAIPEGQDFEPMILEESAKRLRASGVFSTVTYSEGEEVLDDGSLPINLVVSEAKLRRFGVGASVSTNDGATLEGFWLHRNLLGGGERFRIFGKATGIGGETAGTDYELGIDLSKPATLAPKTNSTFQFRFERDKEPDYTLQAYEIQGGFEHIFSDKLEGSIGFAYRDADTIDIFGQRNFHIISLPFDLTFDTRDSEISATKGMYLSFGGSPFVDIKTSETGLRLDLDARAYRPIDAEGSLVAAARLQVGTVVGPDLEDLPADFLFYSGGGGTVRGQKYQSLGVTIAGLGDTGGKSFVGVSGELRKSITERFGAVVFGDAGFIAGGSSPDSNADSHAGYGLGLRFETGLGPIRFDVAVPARKKPELGDLLFYIGIGQAF